MKINEKWLLLIIATIVTSFGIGYNLINGTRAVDTNVTAFQQREAVIETALSYYRQGEQIQYDSYRKNLYASPEDATSNHLLYTVCSGFVFQVYYQTLGIKIPDTTTDLLNYAKANKDKSDTILYYYDSSSADIDSSIAFANFIDNNLTVLMPGDIFVITGHAMLVKSVDVDNKTIEIIDVDGEKYDENIYSDYFEDGGAIRIKLIDTLANDIKRFAFIRIITDGNNYINKNNELEAYEVTSASISRLNYRGIDIEKTVTISNDDDVFMANIGEYITYKINIKNNSDVNYDDISVVENIDPKVLVTDDYLEMFSNNQLKWDNISVPALGNTVIEYTVRVPVDKDLFGQLIISTGYVDNIASSKIETLIGNKFSNDEKEKIAVTFDNIKNNELIEREFINQIYIEAFDLDLGLGDLDNLDIISFDSKISSGGYDSLSVKYTKVNDTSVSKYIYNNYYGLALGSSSSSTNNVVKASVQWNVYPTMEINDRVRTLTSNMLSDGDILLLYNGDNNNLVNKGYIYVDGKLIRKLNSDIFEEFSGDNLTSFLRNVVGENYVILRPSLAIGNMHDYVEPEISFTDDITLDDENKVIYGINVSSKWEDIINKIKTNGDIIVLDKDDNVVSLDSVVKTGYKIKIVFTSDNIIYKIGVKGDITGDGIIDKSDVVVLSNHIIKNNIINDAEYLKAADVNGDGKININDVIKLARYLNAGNWL